MPRALGLARKLGVKFDIMATTFFLSRRSFRASPDTGMPLWQDHLFITLSKSGTDAQASTGCLRTQRGRSLARCL